MRLRPLVIAASLIAVLGGCGLISIKPKNADAEPQSGGLPSTRGAQRRIRFALLAPFEQVANAAGAELRAMGATSLEAAGDSDLRFVIRDEAESGEDFITLRNEGTILVLTFRIHKVMKQGGEITNPGLDLIKKQKDSAQTTIENPGKKLSSESDKKEKETDAAKARRDRIERVIVCLAGVGDVVDADGAPKERQLSLHDRSMCHLRGGDIADGGSPDAASTN